MYDWKETFRKFYSHQSHGSGAWFVSPKSVEHFISGLLKIQKKEIGIENEFETFINKLENKQEFIDYVNSCINNSRSDIGWDFLGFIDDYINLSKIITKEHIIVDVGCAWGLQHIIFKDYAGYIGIDESLKCKPFTNNAKFIKGKFRDVINKIDFNDKMFGIANMSLLYSNDSQEDLELFNKFRKKFIK